MIHFLLGTYTKRVSQGIYRFNFDENTGRASHLQLVCLAGDPFYLAQGPKKTVLCIDHDKSQDQPGGLKLINSANPKQTIATCYDSAASATYLAYDPSRKLAFLANYDINELSLYSVTDQTITLLDRTHNPGINGPRPEQRDGPHPHFINYTPDHRLVVCDLGVDTIFTYEITNDFHLRLCASLKLPVGFGPRHLRFNHRLSIAYAVGELSSQIATLSYNSATGAFTILDITTTIPTSWTLHNGAAAIRLTQDNRFMYVSNRGYNSIAVFSLGPTGRATLIQNVPTGGDFPWDLQFAVQEHYLLVANQRSDSLSVFKRHPDTGQLKLLNADFFLPEPLAILADPIQTN